MPKIEIEDLISSPINAIYIDEINVSIRLTSNTPQSIRDCLLNKFIGLKKTNKLMDTHYNNENSCITFQKRPGTIEEEDLKAIQNIITTAFKADDKTLNQFFKFIELSTLPEAAKYIGKLPVSNKIKQSFEEQIKNFYSVNLSEEIQKTR